MERPSTSGKDTHQTKEKLMQECEETWVDINKLHAHILNSNHDGPIREGDKMQTISEVKVKALKGQLAVESEKELSLLPTDPETLRALLREELEKSVNQLQVTLEVIQGQRRELEEEVKWEKQILAQQKQIHAALEKKVTAAKELSQKSSSSLEEDLKSTKGKTEKEIMRLLKELKTFSKSHFPHPREDEEESSADGASGNQLLSLLDILENFMNKCVEKGGSPYIELDDTYWPPYIELLLRCGVIQRHEQNPKMARLTPFHLK